MCKFTIQTRIPGYSINFGALYAPLPNSHNAIWCGTGLDAVVNKRFSVPAYMDEIGAKEAKIREQTKKKNE